MTSVPELPPAINDNVLEGIVDSQERQPGVTERRSSRLTGNALESGDGGHEIGGNDVQNRCWGKHGKIFVWIGMAVMWTAFEMDHTVLYNYQNYAASDFGQISSLGALQTAGTIIVAVMKPFMAKMSDVVGRVETYMAVVVLYVISYILCATSPSFEQYAGGFVIYSIGATGLQILNQIIVADITTARWRGLANGLINLPFMIVPWLSAFIVESALEHIGWRWGIGMFAIIMPIVSTTIIIPLICFRRRSKKLGIPMNRPSTSKEFFIAIDVFGVTLLTVGCAMFLLPMALAGNVSGGWATPWVPTVTVVGLLTLATFGFYEARYSANPIMPARYFKTASLVVACAVGLLDAFGFQVTHTYMYAWASVARNFSARNATFLTYTAGCFQVLAGLITGYFMYRTRMYKWLLVVGAAVRLIGYGLMLRLRGSSNPVWELFFVQAVQGVGSGMVGTVILVVAQIVVPHAELAQATALILLSIFMGQAIGSAIAGAIYTTSFRERLRVQLGANASANTIDAVFQSISTRLPSVGSAERTAIDVAYSDILGYMSIGALAASGLLMILVWFLPNLTLPDKHNLVETSANASEVQTEEEKQTPNSEDASDYSSCNRDGKTKASK